jgi:hypothetical protein
MRAPQTKSHLPLFLGDLGDLAVQTSSSSVTPERLYPIGYRARGILSPEFQRTNCGQHIRLPTARRMHVPPATYLLSNFLAKKTNSFQQIP